LSDITLQIIFDACWASMNIGSKQPIAWKNSKHAHSWGFYLQCGIEETSKPWHHMYRLPACSSPSIRIWNKLNGETLAGKWSHRKVKRINSVRGH
jgi:hypothetical protein